MEDPIQNLLSSMGWSCDDLLKKLQHFKSISKTSNAASDFSEENDTLETSNSDGIAVEKAESSVQNKEKDGDATDNVDFADLASPTQNEKQCASESDTTDHIVSINTASPIENREKDELSDSDTTDNAVSMYVASSIQDREIDTFDSDTTDSVVFTNIASPTKNKENDVSDSDTTNNVVSTNVVSSTQNKQKDASYSYTTGNVVFANSASPTQNKDKDVVTTANKEITEENILSSKNKTSQNLCEENTEKDSNKIAVISLENDNIEITENDPKPEIHVKKANIVKKTQRKSVAADLLLKMKAGCNVSHETSPVQNDEDNCAITDELWERKNMPAEANKNEDAATSVEVEIQQTTPLVCEVKVESEFKETCSLVDSVNNEEKNLSVIEISSTSSENSYCNKISEEEEANETEIISVSEKDDIVFLNSGFEKSDHTNDIQARREKETAEEVTNNEIYQETADSAHSSDKLERNIVQLQQEKSVEIKAEKSVVEKVVCSKNNKSEYLFLKPPPCVDPEIIRKTVAKSNDNSLPATSELLFSKEKNTEIECIEVPVTIREEEDDELIPNEPKKDEEEVRNLLRMQISQLRNKKKIDVITSTIDKNMLNRTVPESRKKKRKISTDLGNENPFKKIAVEGEESKKKTNLDDAVLSHEHDSEFLIIDVVGGYKSPEHEKSSIIEPECQKRKIINEHLDGEPIHLTKTKNYTDVKGWKHKKIAVPSVEAETPTRVSFFDEAVPSCSYTDLEIEKVEVAPCAVPKVEKNIKSAFESNLLDQFLVEHSQLNISYEVPKLDAEENISQNFNDLLIPLKTCDASLDKNQDFSEDRRSIETYKPKTLAEKRKMIEKTEKRKVVKREVSSGGSDSSMIYSRIYCKGTTLKVPTRVRYSGFLYYITKRGCTKGQRRPLKPYVYESPKAEHPKINSKPSLLTCLKPASMNTISYKPGPLSMKQRLQDRQSSSEWTTVIKKLPKITLEVTPEYCKSIDPRVLNYVKFEDSLVTEERVDFALTALKNDDAFNCRSFTFPVFYKNEEKFMLFRKRRSLIPPVKGNEINTEDGETAVRTVIDKLLNYVEISQIADSLVKQDTEERITQESDFVKPLTPISKNIDAIIKNSRKRKTSLELKRLNVKIIDVDVAEKEQDTRNCSKQFCKMGCICKSLECNKSYSFHCGKEECMLECICNYNRTKHCEERVLLPAGTNLLSIGTVSHLQKQAKRNLAKVEKEFVQTVIQSNDQTIILGSGTRDRQRRTPKLPRKMSDYIGEEVFNNIEEPEKSVPEEKPKSVEDDKIKARCMVKVLRLDLEDVIPFCMVHNLYDCHCRNKAEYPKPVPSVQTAGMVEKIIIDTVNKTSEDSNKKPETPKNSPESRNEIKQSDPTPVYCSRTTEVPTQIYRVRNSAIGYLDHLKKALTVKEKKISRAIVPKFKRHSFTLTSTINAKKNQDSSETIEPLANIDLSKSDHGVEIINISSEKAIQRRKKRVSIGTSNSTEIMGMSGLLEQDPLKQVPPPRSLTEELGRYLGKGSKNKLQVLHWDVLMKRYKNGSLYVWCDVKTKKVLITENRTRPAKNYLNLNFLQHSLPNKEEFDIEIIRCLLTDTVPKNKNPKEILLVLSFKGRYFEVCGICEKSRSCEDSVSLSLISTDLNQQTNEEKEEETVIAEMFVHRTVDGQLKSLPLIRETYERRVLCYQNNRGRVIHVPLPSINQNQRWCVVKLAKRCSYLQFSAINYTILHNDLSDLVKMVKNNNQTVVIKSNYCCKENPKMFNHDIYVVPNCQDMIFIGPYLKTEDAQIETLDYVHQVLVNTDLYSKMKGELSNNCAWMIQLSHTPKFTVKTTQRSLLKSSFKESRPKPMPDLVVIDDDSDNESNNKSAESNGDDDDDVVLVKDKEFLEEGDLKRYLVTNVPGLGYIEVCQLPDSKIIDVKWPFTNNIQRYSKMEDAIPGIQRQLSAFLIPIPEEFKIEVHVIEKLDGAMEPMNPDYAQGHYAVGEFGVRNLVITRANDLPASCGLTDEDIIELLLCRSRKVLLKYCLKFAEIFTSQESAQLKTIEEILDALTKEIKNQERIFDSLNKNKIAQELKRVELSKNCLKLMRMLPPDKEKEVRLHLHSILNNKKCDANSVNPLNVTSQKECGSKDKDEILIEISDDEDDKGKQKIIVKDTNQLMKTVRTYEKIVPPLIKIKNGSLQATKRCIQSNNILMSPVVHNKALIKTQRSLVKIPINKILTLDKRPGQKLVLSLKENTDSDIIKRLKMNSGLQVSVLNKDLQSSQCAEGVVEQVQAQNCQVTNIKENMSTQFVTLKRKVSPPELRQCLILNKNKCPVSIRKSDSET